MSAFANVLNSVVGWAEWKLRNEDGSVAAAGETRNVFTRLGRRGLPAYMDLPQHVVIMDDEHPAGIKQGLNTFKVDQTTPTQQQNFGYTISGYVRTMTGSFGQPAVARTIRKIGLTGHGLSVPGTISEGGVKAVHSYLELSPPIVQQTNQTFEIVYRLAVVPATTKHLKRWQTYGRLEEQAFAADLIAGGAATGSQHHVQMNVLGSRFFFDADASYRGPPSSSGSSNWRTGGASSFSDGTLQRRGRDHTILVTDGDNSQKTGPVGITAASRGSRLGNTAADMTANDDRSYGFFPLVAYEGTLTTVFKHPAGETYWWNVVGSVALSQGAVEIRGPYIPDEDKAPWHWLYAARIRDAGDTDSGTEGTYTIWRNGWFGYPYPSFYAKPDDTWTPAIFLSDLFTTTGDSAVSSVRNQIVFDGEFYYFVPYQSGTNARVFRWRAGSNEQIFTDVTGDYSRFFGFQARAATTSGYAVASNGNGVVWIADRDTVDGRRKVFRLDNTTPGRHYQRPSGVVSSGNPQTFTVSADDEIHAMYPFTVGDVGRKIRIVNTVSNGTESIRTITAFNGPNSVDVDGAAFATEGDMTWHWVTVTEMATTPWGAGVNPVMWLGYDAANGRLWALSTSGLHYSTDGGATWGLINESNGLSDVLAKAPREPNGSTSPSTIVIGNGGKLYWIDTNNGLNKYTPGPSIHSGTHERITMASMPTPPNSYTKGTFLNIYFDPVAPDSGSNTDGALWVGQDAVINRGFFRVRCGPTFSAAAATAFSNISIGNTANTYLDYSFQNAVVLPDGQTYLQGNTFSTSWKRAVFDEATGALTWSNAGDILNGSSTFVGVFHVRDNGIVVWAGGGTTLLNKGLSGFYVGANVAYSYNDLLDVWVPWHGSPAQFNTRFGTTNGGKRKCHASWQKVLKGAQANNLELRFVQNGSVAPADEYVAGEMFSWGAAYGVSRTNVQDLTWRADYSLAHIEGKVEAEAIKTVTGRGALQVYYNRLTSTAPGTAVNLGSVNLPSFDSVGANYGWMPSRTLWLEGGGDTPNTGSASYGPTTCSMHIIGIDFGGSPPVVSKLHAAIQDSAAYSLLHRYHRAAADRGRTRVFYSDDNATWTEVTAVRFQLNGAAQPDAGYRYVYVEQNPDGGDNADVNNKQIVTFDLEAAGLSAGDRTHRYWQIQLGRADGGNTLSAPRFGGVWASDSSGRPLGLTANHRTDEAHDVDHGASWITAIDFIQTRTGLSGQGGINTVDDGDGDGRTNTVSIAAGSFNTGVISTVTDFLAWRESPGYGNGYLRRPRGEAGRAMPWSSGAQARSRIVSVTSSTIVVADDIIPDNLSAVDFEIRRPATGTVLTAGSMPLICAQTGYMQFHPSDAGREFRIARKGIVRLP